MNNLLRVFMFIFLSVVGSMSTEKTVDYSGFTMDVIFASRNSACNYTSSLTKNSTTQVMLKDGAFTSHSSSANKSQIICNISLSNGDLVDLNVVLTNTEPGSWSGFSKIINVQGYISSLADQSKANKTEITDSVLITVIKNSENSYSVDSITDVQGQQDGPVVNVNVQNVTANAFNLTTLVNTDVITITNVVIMANSETFISNK